jgi:hypothetical protein
LTRSQIAFDKCFRSALQYGITKFGHAAEPDLFRGLIDTINAVRNSAPSGEQYLLPHALRDALNTLKFKGDMRKRYASMAGHFFSKMKQENLKKIPKEQIPLTVIIEINGKGQLGWRL